MKKYNTHKIDLLLQYILLTAGQEDRGSRELGMIHLIKYLYLADLAYSEHHNGEIFTGLNWKFYHFGPWAEEVYKRIEPALLAIGAEKKVYPSTKYEKDCVRWSIQNDELYNELDSKLSIILSGAIQSSVHQFGSDTEGLLHFVYKTAPMLQALIEPLEGTLIIADSVWKSKARFDPDVPG